MIRVDSRRSDEYAGIGVLATAIGTATRFRVSALRGQLLVHAGAASVLASDCGLLAQIATGLGVPAVAVLPEKSLAHRPGSTVLVVIALRGRGGGCAGGGGRILTTAGGSTGCRLLFVVTVEAGVAAGLASTTGGTGSSVQRRGW